jgi:hypothetical protein
MISSSLNGRRTGLKQQNSRLRPTLSIPNSVLNPLPFPFPNRKSKTENKKQKSHLLPRNSNPSRAAAVRVSTPNFSNRC